ncbi:MAG: c-type cytochrome [Blastocatellia bacterium]
MAYLKIGTIFLFLALGLSACLDSKPEGYVITDSLTYEASLFRQNCAICHGSEGEGKTLDDGTIVPSLRTGEFKFNTEAEIYKQIAEGGNGMLPFQKQLTGREIQLLTELVHAKLRSQKY